MNTIYFIVSAFMSIVACFFWKDTGFWNIMIKVMFFLTFVGGLLLTLMQYGYIIKV